MGATSSHYDESNQNANAQPLSITPYHSPRSPTHRRLKSSISRDIDASTVHSDKQLLTLREYQMLRATRAKSHNDATTSKHPLTSRQATHDGVTRNSSAPCLSSRSSSSASNLSSMSSSTRHLSPRSNQRSARYTSQYVHPQFTCGNCNTTCNIVPPNNNMNSSTSNTSINSNSSVASTPSLSATSISSDASSVDQNFCNRDCYYSYCFRLAEELDCTADEIIDQGYYSVNGYISQDGNPSQDILSPTSYTPKTTQTRCLQISRVH